MKLEVIVKNFSTIYCIILCAWSLTSCHGAKAKKEKAKKDSCSICRKIVSSFNEGIEKTSKTKHYGGGDTAWEEAKLGAYQNSELRFIEVSESLCHLGDSKEEKMCHQMAEEQEERIEEYWFKHRATQPDFFVWLCVETLQHCCPNNTYGKSCEPCYTADRPVLCSGSGKCSGEGTRHGTGKCKCDAGYVGDDCSSCAAHYFQEAKNDTHVTCTECDQACAECLGTGPRACVGCAAGGGWELDTEDGCIDVDECDDGVDEDNHPACPDTDHTYCVNTPGSFRCEACARQCVGCIGPSNANCVACADDYVLHGGKCMTREEAASEAGPVTADDPENATEGSAATENSGAEAAADMPPAAAGGLATASPSSPATHTENSAVETESEMNGVQTATDGGEEHTEF